MTKRKMKQRIVPFMICTAVLVSAAFASGCSISPREDQTSQALDSSVTADLKPTVTANSTASSVTASSEQKEKPSSTPKPTIPSVVDDDSSEEYATGESSFSKESDTFDTSTGFAEDEVIGTAAVTNADDTSHSADANPETSGIASITPIHEGLYCDERIWFDSSYTTDQTIYFHYFEIYNVTPTSFEFEIYESNNKNNDKNLIFKRHTAIYTGDGSTAVFYGNEYTLTFTLTLDTAASPAVTQIAVTGFEPVEGGIFLNNTISGHHFS